MRGSAVFRTGVAPGGALAGPWVQNSLWTRARAVPSLDLRFADNKSLVDATTGAQLVTHTRASSGTFVGSDGVLQTAATNAPRFDHDPTTGESLGLLVEESRTNLFVRSEEFDDASWTKSSASITTNTTTAPDGTITADTYSGTGSSGVRQTVTLTSGTEYTISFYVKSAGLGNDGFRLVINSAQSSSNFTATSEWQRFTFTATSANTGARTCGIHRNSSGGNVDVLLWGAQLEAGAFPTSYIPTVAATVTRAADVASITGSNFSSSEGTLYLDSNQASITGTLRMVSANNNTSSNRINLTRTSSSGGNINFVVTNAGTNQVAGLILKNSLVAGTSNKVAAGYKAADFGGSVNGLTPVTQSTGTVPSSLTQLTIANGDTLGVTPVNSTTKRLTYWPVRLSNEVLQRITQ
jgi:hypothetical protein